MVQLVKKLWRDEEGPTAVEYALMVGFIATVIIVAVRALGSNVQGPFNTIAGAFP